MQLKRLERLATWPLVICAAALAAVPVHAAEPLTMVTMVNVGRGSSLQWPLYIGMSKGFFAERGIQLDMLAASSSAAVQQQLASGSVPMGSGGLVDPLRAMDKGAKVALLRIEAQAAPYGLVAKPAIKSIAGLRGKTISIGGAKDITRIYLERMLAPHGLKSSQYDLVFAGATAARFAALQAGAIDATILTSPFNFRAEAAGFSNLGLTVEYVKDFPFTGYAVNSEWGRKNKAKLLDFLQAVARSIDWFRQDANRDEAISILMAASNTERRDVELTYDLFRKIDIYDRKGVVSSSALGNLVKALKELGDLEGSTEAGRFIDPELSQLAGQIK
jgi:NitT/TauT family transport system substrate-binding protein